MMDGPIGFLAFAAAFCVALVMVSSTVIAMMWGFKYIFSI